MKRIKVLLWLCVCVILMGSAATVKAEDSVGAAAFTQEESYLTRSFLDLKNYLDIGNGITVTEDNSDKAILLTGNAAIFNNTKIKINRTFQFTGNRVGRLAVDALAGYGNNLKISFYLDDEKDSFASITLKKQGRSDSWNKVVCLQTDVLDKNIRGNHNISFTVTTEDSGAVAVLLRSLEFVESDLPTVYVNVNESLGTISDMNNASKPDTVECYGGIQIETPAGYAYEFGNTSSTQADQIQSYDMDYIRASDYASWGYSQKSYQFALSDSTSILGMNSGKKWNLLCHIKDNSQLRNQMSYWLGRQLGLEATPECVQVDLVINGVYYGDYLLVQAIDPDENYAGMDENSYVLSLFKYEDDSEDADLSTSESLIDFALEYPESADSAKRDEIKNEIRKIDETIMGDGFKDSSGVSYKEYLDIDSMVNDAWMIVASKTAYASFRGTHYMYKYKDGKIHMGPLWDLETTAWGNSAFNAEVSADGFNLNDNSWPWLTRLLDDSEFTQKFIDRWPTVKAKLQECIKDGGVLDQYYDSLLIAQRYNEEKWGMNKFDTGNTDDGFDVSDDYNLESYAEDTSTTDITFAGERDAIKTFIKARIEWIDANLQSFKKEPCKLTFVVDNKTYTTMTVSNDVCIETLPQAPAKSGYVFMGWSYCDADSGETSYADESTSFSADTTLTAVYESVKNLVQPAAIYLNSHEIWVSKTCDDFAFAYSVYPSDAYGTVTFSSSNPSILEVVNEMDTKYCNIHAVGDVTVTATVGKVKSSCLVHVYDPEKETHSFTARSVLDSSITLTKGTYKQLRFDSGKDGYLFNRFNWFSLNSSIASVDSCGVVTAESAGTTYIYMKDTATGKLSMCKVTVPAAKSTVKKGYTYYYKGLRYKVTYKAKKGGNVTVLGSKSKKIKSVNIRSTLTIKGETYKVTAISAKAFYKCKKLRKIYLGSNLKSIGNKAFTGIHKKAVFKAPASKKKAYKKLLTSKKGFRKTMKVTRK